MSIQESPQLTRDSLGRPMHDLPAAAAWRRAGSAPNYEIHRKRIERGAASQLEMEWSEHGVSRANATSRSRSNEHAGCDGSGPCERQPILPR